MLVYKRVKLKPYLNHNYLIIFYLQKGIFSGFFTVIVAAIFFTAINLFKMFYSFFQASYFILKAASLGIKMFFQVFYFCARNEPNI